MDMAEGKYSMKSPHPFLMADRIGLQRHKVRFQSSIPRLCLLSETVNASQNLQNARQIGLQISSFAEKRNSVWVDAETKH
jgi:hypothetical protein